MRSDRQTKVCTKVRAVVMHELGHLVSLDHVEAPSGIMQPGVECAG
ncbi:matrixin family metalloprotease [Aeromicrobium sp.]|nr:matrixin family metalloprotease [Aeromicrobium sp.]